MAYIAIAFITSTVKLFVNKPQVGAAYLITADAIVEYTNNRKINKICCHIISSQLISNGVRLRRTPLLNKSGSFYAALVLVFLFAAFFVLDFTWYRELLNRLPS
jgi:hypothetical protein